MSTSMVKWADINKGQLSNVPTTAINSVTLSSDTTNTLIVTNGTITDDGTISIALNRELDALGQINSVGLIARTASATYVPVKLETSAGGNLTITNGDGASGHPTIDLANNITVTESVSTPKIKLSVITTSEMNALTPSTGNIVCVSDDGGTTGRMFVYNGATWAQLVTL